jgi:hypothetical protein
MYKPVLDGFFDLIFLVIIFSLKISESVYCLQFKVHSGPNSPLDER